MPVHKKKKHSQEVLFSKVRARDRTVGLPDVGIAIVECFRSSDVDVDLDLNLTKWRRKQVDSFLLSQCNLLFLHSGT